jgi:glycerophosphoryl diester phosphodiesterase
MVLKHSKLGASVQPALILGPRPFVVAHRGGARQAPENTIAAFEKANVSGVVNAIELDVQLSKDGHLVVIHDKTVDRTTNGQGPVGSHTLLELTRFDAGYHYTLDQGKSFPYRAGGVTIPTLDQTLTSFPSMTFLVELKDSSLLAVAKLAELIAKHNAHDRIIVVLISAKHGAAVALRKLDPRIKTGHSAREISLFVGLTKVRLGRWFSPRGLTFEVPMRKYRINLPTASFVRQAHRQGISVLVWTINDPMAMRIITDDPATLASVISKRPQG